MTLLSIAQALAPNIGIDTPTEILGAVADDDDAAKIRQFTQEAGNELTRRVDWGALRKTYTITANGTANDYTLPTDFARLILGNSIKSSGATVRVGLSPDEWNSLTPTLGTPRYARLASGKIGFYPYPANAATVTVNYISSAWCGGGKTWSSDSDAALIPEDLITQGALWRWRRNAGLNYEDHLAEFETMLADLSKFDDGIRTP